jgi:hypothetical protein
MPSHLGLASTAPPFQRNPMAGLACLCRWSSGSQRFPGLDIPGVSDLLAFPRPAPPCCPDVCAGLQRRHPGVAFQCVVPKPVSACTGIFRCALPYSPILNRAAEFPMYHSAISRAPAPRAAITLANCLDCAIIRSDLGRSLAHSLAIHGAELAANSAYAAAGSGPARICSVMCCVDQTCLRGTMNA